MRVLAVVAIGVAIATPVIAADLAQPTAEEAFARKDFAEAARLWRDKAEAGSYYAQSNLGLLYYEGRGVPQDYAEAFKWLKRAADQGFAPAEFNLAGMYRAGRGTDKDPRKAVELYKKAAAHEFQGAKTAIGNMYLSGVEADPDPTEAARWFAEAADDGDSRAQLALGTLYVNGRGVARDAAKAEACLRLAALAGTAEAQYDMGISRSSVNDPAGAYKWFSLAVRTTQNPAGRASAEAAAADQKKALSASDLERVDRELDAWRPRPSFWLRKAVAAIGDTPGREKPVWAKALEAARARSGKVVLDCDATVEGGLSHCRPAVEEPAGASLADYAVREIVPTLAFVPVSRGCSPIEAPVALTLSFTP